MCAVCPKFNYQEHLKQSGCECFESNVNSSRNMFLDLRCCKQGIRPLNSYRYLYVTEQVRLCERRMVASAKRVRITPRERKGGSMGEILRTRKRHRSDYLKVRKARKKRVRGLNSQFIFCRWRMISSFWLQTRGQKCVRMIQVRTGAVQTSWSRSKTSNLTVMKNQ